MAMSLELFDRKTPDSVEGKKMVQWRLNSSLPSTSGTSVHRLAVYRNR